MNWLVKLLRLTREWRAFQTFRACCPPGEAEVTLPWSAADAARLQAFMVSAEGERLKATLRLAVHLKEAQACMATSNGDLQRGVALGWRSAVSHLISLSVPSAPQKQEEAEHVLPGAQHKLAERWTP